jgi:hypothetical protein
MVTGGSQHDDDCGSPERRTHRRVQCKAKWPDRRRPRAAVVVGSRCWELPGCVEHWGAEQRGRYCGTVLTVLADTPHASDALTGAVAAAMIRDSSQILRATADTKESIQVTETKLYELCGCLTAPRVCSQIYTSAGSLISSLPV